MKFPSVDYLLQQAAASFRRFFLPLCFAFAGTSMAMVLIESRIVDHPNFLRVLLICVQGLSWTLGAILFAERAPSRSLKIFVPVVVLAFLAIYGCLIDPVDIFDKPVQWITYWALLIAAHLWVSVSAYLQQYERHGFWRFNEVLFARMFLSALFSGCLYAGVALAVLACDKLFKVHIREEAYGHLFAIVAGIFNTWFFMAGLPRDYKQINEEQPFPFALKIFAQYILIPIVLLFMAILYVYSLQILVQWKLPRGWVSTLIMCYAVVGVLAILLSYPLRNDATAKWVSFFSRFFFTASIPIICLLFVAIGVRVNEYGITESRYYLVMLACWFSSIAVYFIVSKEKSIRVIPVSLATLAIVSLWGPWSAFSFSTRSQLARLEELLMKNGIWKPGSKVSQSGIKLKEADADNARDIIRYLINNQRLSAMQPIFAADLAKMEPGIYGKPMHSFYEKDSLAGALSGILFTNVANNEWTAAYHTIRSSSGTGRDVAGYSREYEVSFNGYANADTQQIVVPGYDSVSVVLHKAGDSVYLKLYSLHGTTELGSIDVTDMNKRLTGYKRDTILPASELTQNGVGKLQPRIVFSQFTVTEKTEDTVPAGITEGTLLLKL